MFNFVLYMRVRVRVKYVKVLNGGFRGKNKIYLGEQFERKLYRNIFKRPNLNILYF